VKPKSSNALAHASRENWRDTLHDALWNFLFLDTKRMMNTIRGSRARIDQMITHTFPTDRIVEAMDF
jgi:hypothetical protein